MFAGLDYALITQNELGIMPEVECMRVAFAGGKNVGYMCLKSLIESDVDVIAVIINKQGEFQPSRWFESTAELALRHGLRLLMPENINAPGFVRTLADLKPDLMTVVYYDQILRPPVLAIPPLGCINLHLGLAEEYRGCYPTTWALINGETRTGVTLHYVDEGIDSGDIIAQDVVPIEPSDTGRTLYDKCSNAGSRLFASVIPQFRNGKVAARKQNGERVRYHKREFPSQRVDFGRSGAELYDFVRAQTFEPFPPPYFYIGDTKMVIVPEDKANSRRR